MPQQIAEEVHYESFEEEAKAQEIIETPKHRTTSGVQMFQMTPQRDGAEDSWQKDAVDEWLDQEEDPQAISPSFAQFFRKRVQAVSAIALMETVSEATSHGIILQGVACYAQEVETGQARRAMVAVLIQHPPQGQRFGANGRIYSDAGEEFTGGAKHVKLHYDYTDAMNECLNCYGDASWATGAAWMLRLNGLIAAAAQRALATTFLELPLRTARTPCRTMLVACAVEQAHSAMLFNTAPS
ncbi:hypothetical protein AK812_SmicGene26186 [Symbiodinium microadriaticum]|uniref:Uncharacterized protein n=1 Tax=Symbiodinium microadriaticum TaxID=2951 RepID=A0A1Q9DAC0_SYMMI|nr:hypothetical protein AK812_SmicGene26186 [Symbiodinium microadriaticum]